MPSTSSIAIATVGAIVDTIGIIQRSSDGCPKGTNEYGFNQAVSPQVFMILLPVVFVQCDFCLRELPFWKETTGIRAHYCFDGRYRLPPARGFRSIKHAQGEHVEAWSLRCF